MKIIAELETSPRRIYTGSIGYIAPNRKARFNVAIRTALVDKVNRKAEYGVGGGIVWDSTSADEYSEALLKARVLTDPPGAGILALRNPALDSPKKVISCSNVTSRA
jgi:para-aminobenzoate synthetase / 4-amino-4-deoxychorismate lyase